MTFVTIERTRYPNITYDDPRNHLKHPLEITIKRHYYQEDKSAGDQTTLRCKQCNIIILQWMIPAPYPKD